MIPINEYVFQTKAEADNILRIIFEYGWISKYDYCALTCQHIPDDKRYQYLKESACDRDDVIGVRGTGWKIITIEES